LVIQHPRNADFHGERGDWGFGVASQAFLLEEPRDGWIAIATVFLVLTTAMTYPLAIERSRPPKELRVSWRGDGNKYYHEWRTVLLGLAIAIICFRIYCSYEMNKMRFRIGESIIA
jgi:hypothetical protein